VTATILDGREVARTILDGVKERVRFLTESATAPRLCFVSIGDSGPAEVYVRRLESLGSRVGAYVARVRLSRDLRLLELESTVSALNADETVDGILVQMPLPDYLDPGDISALIEPRKDVDGVTTTNAGKLYLGMPGQMPPTALGMVEMLHFAGVSPTGKHAVVVGRSNVVGHPVAELLLQEDATLTVVHRQTEHLSHFTRQADILMVGAGEPNLITARDIKEGVVIIDAGINVTEHGVVGDVVFEECAALASAISPVPGGVGPVTNAMLLRNLVDSAEQRVG
jgi:methylenetetrahydrofolate dehydrogenase (NADP+)/methenyltetrahydrofolate cyclohydrolase